MALSECFLDVVERNFITDETTTLKIDMFFDIGFAHNRSYTFYNQKS